jgi:hypothetical protein
LPGSIGVGAAGAAGIVILEPMIYPMLKFVKVVEARGRFVFEISAPTNFGKREGYFAIHNAKSIRPNT